MLESPILIKIGGSLLREDNLSNLRRLAAVISAHARHEILLIIPGGGPFADLVRKQHQRLHLHEETSHFMAIAAMDQFAWLLHELISDSEILELQQANEISSAPGCYILLLSHYLRCLPTSILPRSWQVTSDSIAAHVAAVMNCRALLLLKSADFTSADIAQSVDEYFPYLLPLPFPTHIINGCEPQQLSFCLDNNPLSACPAVMRPANTSLFDTQPAGTYSSNNSQPGVFIPEGASQLSDAV